MMRGTINIKYFTNKPDELWHIAYITHREHENYTQTSGQKISVLKGSL